ncbi:CDGSH iron-sulfur domain-containing protein [Chitinivibrio alkaliphilus]|uniref:Zinc finger CDGSH-type domain protein n=1 Tax=Chitinivibrio alkaliphilus ACht1 TaxID=1313304 RepID=U7DAB5_9BACT|nr:CDGSH iron-sulfur domain-containing protein [Chitinivibrio alkaliphilus]ERP31330.1 zinc finger CDGSH-type domain protein [Chitinivibrio alkaliphilus ACht1]
MKKPIVAKTEPARLTLDPGTYSWCSCGKSENQPFCDGSHVGTDFAPYIVTLTEQKKVSLCQCKQTKNPPYCDGTHRSLSE